MINEILAMLNVTVICFGIVAYRSPKFKFWLGCRLQASAKADEIRQQHYKALVSQFDVENA